MSPNTPPETLDEAGMPDLDGPLPQKARTGDPQEGLPPPATRPASLDYGTTATEQRRGEPIGVRTAREQPDVDVGEQPASPHLDTPIEAKLVDVDDELLASGEHDDAGEAGFVVVAPEDEDVVVPDGEPEEQARRGEPGELGLSPEEAALHAGRSRR